MREIRGFTTTTGLWTVARPA